MLKVLWGVYFSYDKVAIMHFGLIFLEVPFQESPYEV